jgi:Tol biopolymer transport system component
MDTRSKSRLAAFATVLLVGTVVFVATMNDGSRPFPWQISEKTVSANGVPFIANPSYAPDGREVAFDTQWRGYGGEIWVVSAVDGRLRPLTSHPATARRYEDSQPAWSPNGKWIAFASDRTQGAPTRSNIWLVRPDGSGLTQLTRDAGRGGEPAWSPNGMRVAFTTDSSSGWNDIWAINAHGGNLRQLTKRPESWAPNLIQSAYHPAFSPDGSQIVFSQGFDPQAMGDYKVGNKLVIINANGTGARQLTTGEDPDYHWYPSWSKRGILFHSRRHGIMMIQPNGADLHAIPNVNGWYPTWSPDGAKFAFIRGGDYKYNVSGLGIYEFNFSSGTTRALVQFNGYFIAIDIMPGTSPKIVSLKGTTLIRVVIPAAEGFDPGQKIDRTSITFGRTGEERSLASCIRNGKNLICDFKTGLTGFRPGDTQAILRLAGNPNRLPLEGRGTIQIIP